MDHIQHHLRLLSDAIRAGNRPVASDLAGDMADIFAAFDDEDGTPPPALPAMPNRAIEDCRK